MERFEILLSFGREKFKTIIFSFVDNQALQF